MVEIETGMSLCVCMCVCVQVVLVGATVTAAQVDHAVSMKWLQQLVMLRVGGPLEGAGDSVMPTALTHRCVGAAFITAIIALSPELQITLTQIILTG